MKSKTLRKKLVLNKKTIADLTIGKMMNVQGGIADRENPVELTEYCTGATSCNCTGPTGVPLCPACPTC